MRELRNTKKKFLRFTIIFLVITIVCNFCPNPGVKILCNNREFVVNILIGITTGLFIGYVTAIIAHNNAKFEKEVKIVCEIMKIEKKFEVLLDDKTKQYINKYRKFDDNGENSCKKIIDFDIKDIKHIQNRERFKNYYVNMYKDIIKHANLIGAEIEYFQFEKNRKNEGVLENIKKLLENLKVISKFEGRMFNTDSPASLLEEQVNEIINKELLNEVIRIKQEFMKINRMNRVNVFEGKDRNSF